MKNSKDSAARNEPEALEFTDWSAIDDSTATLSSEAALKLPGLYRSWYTEAASRLELSEREKSDVEFVL
jgi:hypothetical protein